MDSNASQIINTMKERHSVKHYQKDVKIQKDELDELISIATTAPSSWNLQHWHFLVIDDEEKKGELLPIAYHQKQVVEASAVIAILGDLQANKEAEGIYTEAVANGVMTEAVKETLVGQINAAYSHSESIARDEAFLNASLASMQLMIAAKAKGYDTCPIGGFNKDAFVKQFHVPERYIPIMLITVGKPEKPAYPSSRKPVDQKTTYNTF